MPGDVELEVEETSPLASVPSGFRPIELYDDVDLVVEGSEEAEAMKTPEPPELAGKTKEDLFAQLKVLQDEVTAQKARNDPVTALGSSFQQILDAQRQAIQPQQQQQQQETPEARRTRLNNLWLENPTAAAEEMGREQNRMIVDLMLQNQTVMSKDMAMMDPQAKQVMDKWGQEVEREVQGMNPVEKAQNPRVYQTAIQRVRARHSDDLVADMVEQAVQKRLQELGIQPSTQKGPAVYSPAGQQRSAQAPAAQRAKVVVPRWVVEDADRQGLDPKFYYQHLKSKGVVR